MLMIIMIMYVLLMSLLFYLFTMMGSLISVAYIILLERKILGYLQNRKGPNKVGMLGVIQPFSDAIKLFLKENVKLIKGNYYYYYLSPMIGFFLSLLSLLSLFNSIYMNMINFSLLYFLCCLSMLVYTIMVGGWSSNSNYSLLGGVRSVIQSLSYEVCLFMLFLVLFMYSEGLNLLNFLGIQFYLSLMIINIPMFFLFMLCILADLNRIPFDLIEGESELVSGFNTEYMSGSFALFFLGEYLLLMVMSMWMSLMFFGSYMISMKFLMEVFMFISIFIILRGVLPRLRFDMLMYMCWYELLPLIMIIMYLLLSYKYYLYLIL